MATSKIKSTYSLDVETVRVLDAMARRLGIPKSEALRRAIHSAAAGESTGNVDALMALTELQESLGLSGDAASKWKRKIREERRATPRPRTP